MKMKVKAEMVKEVVVDHHYLGHDGRHGQVDEANEERTHEVHATDSHVIRGLIGQRLAVGLRQEPLAKQYIQGV